MFDKEILRNQQLIEERIEYENEFISIEDIIKSEELDYYTTPQFEEYFNKDFEFKLEDDYMDDFDGEFAFEDYLDQLRDEQLIEERLAYEHALELEFEEHLEEFEYLDAQIEDLDNENFVPDFDYCEDCIDYFDHYEDRIPDYDCFDYDFDDCYVEEINMDAAYCGDGLFGYIVDDNDGFDEYDYPEGPDENLGGFRYPEPEYFDDCFDFPMPDIDFQAETYYCSQMEYEIQDDDGVSLFEEEQSRMQNLIAQHIREENEFYEFVAKNEVKDEYFLPAGAEDIIFL